MAKEIDDKRDLIFSFENEPSIDRFDDDTTHLMSHANMKRVDFIVSFAERTLLIEVTDPDCPISDSVPPKKRDRDRNRFRKQLHSGTLISDEFAPKLRDTLVYLALAHRSPLNDIVYIALIAMEDMDNVMLQTLLDDLERQCYLPGPGKRPWASNFNVAVLNIAAWNRQLAPHSVRRKSSDQHD